jgi:probable rRNA maturation factor
MKIELINDHYKKIPEPFKKKEIKKLIDVVLKKIGFQELENGQINIKYTSEEEIKMLNEKFYNKEGVTNVLAFINNQETPESKEQLIGEIAICISQIEKEAKLYKKAVETRLKHMIVHGVLHLFGFDHQKKSEQKEMEQVEDDIITSCLGERPY